MLDPNDKTVYLHAPQRSASPPRRQVDPLRRAILIFFLLFIPLAAFVIYLGSRPHEIYGTWKNDIGDTEVYERNGKGRRNESEFLFIVRGNQLITYYAPHNYHRYDTEWHLSGDGNTLYHGSGKDEEIFYRQ